MAKSHMFIYMYIIICYIIPSGAAQSCGSRLTASSSSWRYIRPRTSGGRYYNGENCVWYITAPNGKGIKLHIYSVDLEPYCGYDGVEVYGGASTSGPKLAPTICDTGISATRYLYAPNEIVVRFYTDGSVIGSGFTLGYITADLSACSGYSTDSNSHCSGTSTNRRCSCNTGYEATGNSFMSCQFSSQWNSSITPVSCTKQNCSTGSSSVSASIYKSTCLPGYGLVKRQTNYNCQSDSSWPVIPTSCSKVSCGSAPSVQNSRSRVIRGMRYQDTVTYTCLPGYERTRGSGTITCQSNRRWSTVPICSRVNCRNPPSVQNTNSRSSNGTRYRDTATYTCLPGYEITRGSGTTTCQSNRRWSTPPICSKVSCGSPPSVQNTNSGSTHFNGTRYRDTATYTCLTGYELTRGNGTITCQSNRRWSTVPTCSKVSCGHPSRIQNSNRRSNGTRYLDTATYTCLPGYEITRGNGTIICQSNRTWSTPPICSRISCGDPPLLHNTTMTGPENSTGNRYQDRATYICMEGYEITNTNTSANSSTLVCQSNKNWTSVPSCSRISCGDPPVVHNTTLGPNTSNGTRYRDTATYICLPGYEIINRAATITCQSSRSWSTVPICTRKNCGSPPSVANGRRLRTLHNTTFDAEVTYTCDHLSFIMRGSATVRCTEDGTWSTPPICHRVNCGPPPSVTNSKATVTGHSYNDTVTYECEAGYEISGNESIHCQIFGHWTVPPTCTARKCPDPSMIDNAANVSSYGEGTVGDSVEYICLPGYEISGDSTVECLSSLQWSTLPNCNKINCGPPPAVLHAQATVTGYAYNGTVTFECDTGYQLIGSDTVTCQPSSFWTIAPYCQGLPCPDLPVVANAENVTSVSVKTVGDSVGYICLPGYEISGDSTVECLPTLQWSTLPSCNRVRCGTPYTVANSNREVSGHYLYDITVYTCHHGYQLSGNNTIYCKEDGHWSAPPECHRPGCGIPIFVENSRREISGQFLHDTTVYTCLHGYQISGNSTIYCQEDGNWTASPECSSHQCQDPPLLTNAFNISTGVVRAVGDTVQYFCLPGYEMSGDATVECLPTLQWSTSPNCNKLNCGSPPTVSNSRMTANGHLFNDSVTYDCDIGYNLTGNSMVMCLESGFWSVPPVCLGLPCPHPSAVDNTYNVTGVYNRTVGEFVEYFCLPGYEISGDSTVECLPTLQWSTLPSCNKVNCGPPPEVDDSQKDVEGHQFQDTTEYECDVGYQLIGNSSITCLESGNWDVPPHCQALPCQNLTSIQNSLNMSSSFSNAVGSSVEIICLPGYEIVGDSTVECLPTLQWSALPSCNRVNCGPPPTVVHSQASVIGHLYNESVTYECDQGYELIRDSTISCLSSGHWAVPPTCQALPCPDPPLVTNSLNVSVGSNRTVEDSVEYVCLPGYEIVGDSTVECLPTLQWSTLPSCNKVNCGPPPMVVCSQSTVTGHLYNDSVTYECDEGYELTRGSTIFCLSSGHWSVPPICKALPCQDLPPMNYTLNGSESINATVGDTFQVLCLPGYEIDGDSTVECLPTLQWSTLPSCNKVNCGPPPTVQHSHSTATGYLFNDSTRYHCETGYDIIGNVTLFCTDTGDWSDPPVCQGQICPDPPAIEFAKDIPSGYERTVGDSVEYICLPGYVIFGDPTVECLPTLQWSTLPSCNKVRCGAPYIVANSNREVSGHYLYDITVYTCLHEHQLSGNSTIYCKEDGHWSAPPECHSSDVLRCGTPHNVENSIKVISGYYVNDTTIYTCLHGYQLFGNNIVYCKEDGYWSAPPECHNNNVRCGTPPTVENSRRETSGHYLGDASVYTCFHGYQMFGNNTVYCNEDGHWSAPPECHILSCGLPPQVPRARTKSISGFKLGETIYFECVTGEFNSSTDYIICESSGNWSQLPYCKVDEVANSTIAKPAEPSLPSPKSAAARDTTDAHSERTGLIAGLCGGFAVIMMLVTGLICWRVKKRSRTLDLLPIDNALYGEVMTVYSFNGHREDAD